MQERSDEDRHNKSYNLLLCRYSPLQLYFDKTKKPGGFKVMG